MKEFGTWTVVFNDGTTLGQFDTDSPLCHESGEVPFRAIDWTKAESLILESQWARAVYTLHAIPEGFKRSLRMRRFMTMDATGLMAFILLLSKDGEEVNEESVTEAHYWFPDGTTHECPHFDCPDVRNYATGWLGGKTEKALMPCTKVILAEADAHLETES